MRSLTQLTHHNLTAIAQHTSTKSGLITRAPLAIATRAPNCAPTICASPMLSPITQTIFPPRININNAAMFDVKFNSFVRPVASTTPNPKNPTSASMRNDPVPGPNTPS